MRRSRKTRDKKIWLRSESVAHTHRRNHLFNDTVDCRERRSACCARNCHRHRPWHVLGRWNSNDVWEYIYIHFLHEIRYVHHAPRLRYCYFLSSSFLFLLLQTFSLVIFFFVKATWRERRCFQERGKQWGSQSCKCATSWKLRQGSHHSTSLWFRPRQKQEKKKSGWVFLWLIATSRRSVENQECMSSP
jgi:hypothetical protein